MNEYLQIGLVIFSQLIVGIGLSILIKTFVSRTLTIVMNDVPIIMVRIESILATMETLRKHDDISQKELNDIKERISKIEARLEMHLEQK